MIRPVASSDNADNVAYSETDLNLIRDLLATLAKCTSVMQAIWQSSALRGLEGKTGHICPLTTLQIAKEDPLARADLQKIAKNACATNLLMLGKMGFAPTGSDGLLQCLAKKLECSMSEAKRDAEARSGCTFPHIRV